MSRFVLLALLTGLLFAAAPLAQAEDKDKEKDKPKAKAGKKPIGTWTREAGNVTITFKVTADDFTFHIKDGDGNTLEAVAAYSVTKDGVLFGCMTKVTKKGIDAPTEKGDLFSIAFTFNDKEATASDLKGTHVHDEGRKLVEGVYKKE
jgi:hypothetical protein